MVSIVVATGCFHWILCFVVASVHGFVGTLGSAATLGSVATLGSACILVGCCTSLTLVRLVSTNRVWVEVGAVVCVSGLSFVLEVVGIASWKACANIVSCCLVCVLIGGSSGLSTVLLSAAVRSLAVVMINASRDALGMRNPCGNHLTCCATRTLPVCFIQAR